MNEFRLGELITWLDTLQSRYEAGGPITARLEGTGLNIYQDGAYRVAVQLDDPRPFPFDWADDDA